MANTKGMVYLVLAIIILHIISFRLSFGVKAYINTDKNVGVISVKLFFIPIFRKKINIKRLLRGKEDIKQDNDDEQQEKSGKPSRFKSFLKDCAIGILKAVCVMTANLQAKIGTGDAATDGMAVGMLRIAYSQFCAFFGFDGDGGIIEPDYNSEILFFDFFGIFSISFADIIFAVCCVIFEKLAHVGGRRSYANVAE
ncbi:MAG: hypothetical protein K2J01_01170 [Clostridiales bacterium]|nr:hypothetical protein [Clostridiales bacterium]